jgi:hypothetical protein
MGQQNSVYLVAKAAAQCLRDRGSTVSICRRCRKVLLDGPEACPVCGELLQEPSRSRPMLPALMEPKAPNPMPARPRRRRLGGKPRILLDFHGRRQSLTAWAKELGLVRHTLYQRVRAGWPVERALTEGAARESRISS